MKVFLNFILSLLKYMFPFKETSKLDNPSVPPVNPKKGLFSMDLYAKDKVVALLTNPMVIGAFNNKIDLSAAFNLKFPCYLLPNSNQAYSLSLVDGGIKLQFDKTCPKLYAEKFFAVETEIDFVYITQDNIRISLVGLPDFMINLK